MLNLEAKLNEYIKESNSIGIELKLCTKGNTYSLLIEGTETKSYKSIEELVNNVILGDTFSTIEEAQENI